MSARASCRFPIPKTVFVFKIERYSVMITLPSFLRRLLLFEFNPFTFNLDSHVRRIDPNRLDQNYAGYDDQAVSEFGHLE